MTGGKESFMKKIAIVFVLLWSAAAGAVPSTINFTGRLTTSTGPVNGSVNLTLKLFDVASGGTALWTEIHSNVGADNGLVFVDAGTFTTLDETIFDGRRLYLEIVVNTESLTPRLAINSVPYAMRTTVATNADFLGGSIGPGDVVTSVNGSSGVVATKAGNTVAVSLSTTGCASGQAYKFNGTTFACANDLNTTYTGGAGVSVSGTTISLNTIGCSNGQVYKFNGTTFACAPDADTTYTAGTGVNVTGTTIALSTTGCVAGSVWKFNGTAFVCQPDASNTYTGLTGSGITINASNQVGTDATVQRRTAAAPATCPNGFLRSMAVDGTSTCVTYGADGIVDSVARSDHTHNVDGTIGFNHSHLPTSEWHCSVGGGTLTVQAVAICCVTPIVNGNLNCSQVISVAGPDELAICPVGTKLTGGGCDISGAWTIVN